MIGGVEPAALQQFRSVVATRLGLDFDDSKLDELADVLRQRLHATRSPATASYLERLGSPSLGPDELRAVAERLTVGETYFFRNPAHLHAFADRVLGMAAEVRGGRDLRLVSAGCASGEEAYSLAMLLHDRVPDLSSWQVKIVGIDINRPALEKARRGRYTSWSLRATPPEAQERWFRREGQEFCLDDRVRRLVTFEERNILHDDPGFWTPEAFDVVFCRNVFIYFTPDAFRAAVARFRRALKPGGLLFLGDAETLRGVSHDFHLCHTHETFYYQRREPHDRAPVSPWSVGAEQAPLPEARGPAAPESPPPVLLDGDDSWLDAIQRASERIATLAARSATADAPAAAGGSTMRTGSGASSPLGRATELFRQERFSEAMEVLRSLPSEAAGDPDVHILHAIMLTNKGQVAEARGLCQRVLELDEFNAGAHYLMALCCEHVGDTAGAREHDRIALYLEPAFAMPRLHLGVLSKRAGDLPGARHELTRAMDLLEREDASRILLFGGGFNRDALLQVCGAELKACGGRA